LFVAISSSADDIKGSWSLGEFGMFHVANFGSTFVSEVSATTVGLASLVASIN
jgi:hypothetical protein